MSHNHNYGSFVDDFSFLNNQEFVNKLNELRSNYSAELDHYADYRLNKFISHRSFVDRVTALLDVYDKKFLDLWNSLEFEEKVKILSTSNSFLSLAERFANEDEILAARIIK